MSKLAVHIQHFKKSSVGGIASHNHYKRSEKDLHSNQDIDPSRSKDNVLLVAPEKDLYSDVKALVAGATGRVTASSVWVSEWIVYPPEELQDPKTADKEKVVHYFADVSSWMQQQGYTIPMATIHLDESTIHAHFDTVPLTADGRLSRKDLYTRSRLGQIHTDLAAHLAAKGWDIQRGESTAGKQVRSKTVAEFKKDAEKAKAEILEQVQEAQIDLANVEAAIESAEELMQLHQDAAFTFEVIANEKTQEAEQLENRIQMLQPRADALEDDVALLEQRRTQLFDEVKKLEGKKEALQDLAAFMSLDQVRAAWDVFRRNLELERERRRQREQRAQAAPNPRQSLDDYMAAIRAAREEKGSSGGQHERTRGRSTGKERGD